ncbi:S-layer family protein, partial [Aquabacterium sp.]|uniref:beta strand repeat-containing protein n=1 Tax=Aquabacterium sp. TaxID=1872578 RepID=UPI0025BA896E
FSGTVTGFVNGENQASATTGTLSFGSTATGSSSVGSYGITGSGLTATNGNYTFTQSAGNTTALTINPATLTVTANNASKTYDGLSYSGGNGVSYSGFVNGETSSIVGGSASYGGSSQGASNAGSYAITPSGLSASNYTLNYVDGTLTITPAVLAIITGNLTGTVSKVYNGNNTATLTSSNYLLSGWVGSDGATVTKTTGTYDNANAGTNKTVTVSLGLSDFSATGTTNLSNYTLPTSVTGNVGTITRAALTLTASGGSKTYDGGTTSSGTVSVSGLQGSDTITGLSQVYANKNAGTGKTISVASGYTLSDGNSGSNYDVSMVDASNGVITRASASVSGTATSVTYNGSTQTQTAATRSGFVNGDDISVSGLASGRNAGTYTSSLVVGGNDASNYDVSITNANLSITRAALTLTANAGSKTYDGGTSSSGTVSVSGLQGSDTITGLSQVYANKNAGT